MKTKTDVETATYDSGIKKCEFMAFLVILNENALLFALFNKGHLLSIYYYLLSNLQFLRTIIDFLCG